MNMVAPAISVSSPASSDLCGGVRRDNAGLPFNLSGSLAFNQSVPLQASLREGATMSDPNWDHFRSNGDRFRSAGQRLAGFFRRRHMTKTAACIAAAAGVSENSAKRWLKDGTVPNGDTVAALIVAYGPAFVAALVGGPLPAWLDEAVKAQDRAAYDARLQQLKHEFGLTAGE